MNEWVGLLLFMCHFRENPPMALSNPNLWNKGHKIKSRFSTPSPSLSAFVHMRLTPHPLWTSTLGRHEIHITLLKQLIQWLSDLKLKFDNNTSVLYLKLCYCLFILLICILYWRKMSSIYFVRRWNSCTRKLPTSLFLKIIMPLNKIVIIAINNANN